MVFNLKYGRLKRVKKIMSKKKNKFERKNELIGYIENGFEGSAVIFKDKDFRSATVFLYFDFDYIREGKAHIYVYEAVYIDDWHIVDYDGRPILLDSNYIITLFQIFGKIGNKDEEVLQAEEKERENYNLNGIA